jgi:uncharacterized protein (AIM24 family)
MPRKKNNIKIKYSKKITGGTAYDNIHHNCKIHGHNGSHYVKFTLHSKQNIVTALGSVIYISDGIEGKLTWGVRGIGQGIMNIFAGETVYYQKYSAVKDNAVISVGSSFIDSIFIMKIYKGQQYRLSKNSFLACTDNIKITGVIQWKGLFGIGNDEGFVLPVAYCETEEPGYIWLSAYGVHEVIQIPENQYYIIDNGMFLACNNKLNYTIERFDKSWTTTLLGGEGFGMKYTGPCNIIVQSKNINQLYAKLQVSNTGTQNTSIIQDVASGLFEAITGT